LTPPAPAVAIGAMTLCYGPAPATSGPGTNLYDYNMLDVTPVVGSSTNPDGSVLITGASGDKYGASLCSARKVGSVGQGFAFGPNSFVEVDAKFVPTLDPNGVGGKLPFPAIWALAIKRLLQVGGTNEWSEVDVMQWGRDTTDYVAGLCWIYWTLAASVTQPNNGLVKLNGINLENYNRFGLSWEEATPTSLGCLRNYLNGIERPYAVGKPYPLTWAYGDRAGTVLDNSQLALIYGTHPDCPLTISSACVWSRSPARNWVQ
jgi:hypothetical protein